MDVFIPTFKRDYEQLSLLLGSLSSGRLLGITSINICSLDTTRDLSELMRLVATFKLPIKPEIFHADALGCGADYVNGWLRQQVAKIKFSRIANSDFYLILDSKNFFIRNLDIATIVNSGRFPCATSKPSIHLKWWKGSTWALNHKTFDLSDRNVVGASTPPIFFHRKTVLDLIELLQDRHRSSFEDIFAKRRPIRHRFMRMSEFTLYYSYVDMIGEFEKIHYWNDRIMQFSCQVWRKHSDQIISSKIQSCLSGEATGFVAGFQHDAWTRVSMKDKAALFKKFGSENYCARRAEIGI